MGDGFDAVVVGSGPNGLVGALRLAEAGMRVLVVEAAATPGGGLRTEELTLPGFRHDVCASVLPLTLASPAFRALRLDVPVAHPPVAAAHPLVGAPAALALRDLAATAAGLGRDAPVWRAAVGATARAGFPLVDTLLAPLDRPVAPLAAARYGMLGALPATAVARLFRTTAGRALLGGMAAHSILDLAAPITAGYGMLLAALAHTVGWPVVAGGSQVLAEALVARLMASGAEIVTGVRVTDLEQLPAAPRMLLDVAPRRFLAMAGARLPTGYRRRLARFRHGPGVFKLDYALDGPVPWLDPAVAAAGTVHVGGSFAELAAAEREVARGRHPVRPFVIAVQATAADPSRAPAGKHTLWAYCHVPHGSTVDQTAAVEAQLERFAPGFRDRVLARHVLGPAELEARNPNLIGGDIGGGAGDWRQFLARPVLARAPWRTPLPGVFLCSASTPPGGGAHGMGGWQAAGLALRR